mmetsp:Transcript_48026/g.66684  ORF Transcript_48026/g.66684 Transcript_48026/m.66684 type:complete len:120 (-) Transcript_48026:95-454(-)
MALRLLFVLFGFGIAMRPAHDELQLAAAKMSHNETHNRSVSDKMGTCCCQNPTRGKYWDNPFGADQCPTKKDNNNRGCINMRTGKRKPSNCGFSKEPKNDVYCEWRYVQGCDSGTIGPW